jgi:hypothetical protein
MGGNPTGTLKAACQTLDSRLGDFASFQYFSSKRPKLPSGAVFR